MGLGISKMWYSFITRSKGIRATTKSMSVSSTSRSVQQVLRYPMMPKMPMTAPMLNRLEPRMSPILMAGFPSIIEKKATTISGVEVSTARIMKPADASLNPVISMSFSIDFMAKWLADAKPTTEAVRISN